jgi:hypothetical protein
MLLVMRLSHGIRSQVPGAECQRSLVNKENYATVLKNNVIISLDASRRAPVPARQTLRATTVAYPACPACESQVG